MFNFKIEPKVTRELLLSTHNEETYMNYYLNIPVKKGLFVSPLRADKHKTCSFFRGKSGTLYFKDFATGECLDFVNVVMKKHECDYHEALKIIAQDFGIIDKTIVPPVVKIQPKFDEPNTTIIQCEIQDFSESELEWWKSFGITKKTLDKYRIFSIKAVLLNGNVFARSTKKNPIFGYYFGKRNDIEQWKIYFPQRKKHEVRFIGNINQKMFQGFDQLPKNGKVVVITKSLKDVAALSEYGIPACAPHSEVIIPDEKIVKNLKSRFNHVFVLWDCDLVGVTFLNKIRKRYPDLRCLIIPRNLEAKDFSDLRKKYGREQTLKFINQYLKWLKNR